MVPYSSFLNSNGCDLSSDVPVDNLYHSLRPRVKGLVYSLHVSLWQGQEDDTANDLVQEAVVRTWQCCQRATRDEGRPVDSPRSLCATIARNYCIDKSRQDRRYVRVGQGNRQSEDSLHNVKYPQDDPLEEVIERVFEEALLKSLPPEIVKFPYKQRRALLIDLANRMDFDGPPTVLQKAFLNVGIRLQDYQVPLPADPIQLSRHRSLVSLAYKRLKGLTCVKQYCSAA